MRILQAGERGVQVGGGVQAAAARHLDVEDGDVGASPPRGRHDLVARGDLADDLEVVLQAEQQRQGAAHHALVLGEQHLDQDSSFAVRAGRAVLAGSPGFAGTAVWSSNGSVTVSGTRRRPGPPPDGRPCR